MLKVLVSPWIYIEGMHGIYLHEGLHTYMNTYNQQEGLYCCLLYAMLLCIVQLHNLLLAILYQRVLRLLGWFMHIFFCCGTSILTPWLSFHKFHKLPYTMHAYNWLITFIHFHNTGKFGANTSNKSNKILECK